MIQSCITVWTKGVIYLTRIERTLKDQIINALRIELEYVEGSIKEEDYYSQWIMGVSIEESDSINYLCKTVVKTSESEYVDGTDIRVILSDNEVELDLSFAEEEPIFHGGEETAAIKWLKELKGSIDYISLIEPKDIKKKDSSI